MRSLQYLTRLLFLGIVLPVLITATIPARTVPVQGAWSWVTFNPPGEGFSVRMPKQPSREPVEMPNAPNLAGTSYSATGGGIYFTVKSIRAERGGTPHSRLDDFIARYRAALSQTGSGARLTDGRAISLDGFVGQQFRITAPGMRGLVRIYSTAQRIYVLEVAGGDEEDAPVGWFLDSFTINEPRPTAQAQGGNGGGSRTGGGSDYPQRPIQTPVPKPLDYRQCGCDPTGELVEQESADGTQTRDAILCTKGELELTDEAVKHQFSGDVILEVELRADGTIGGIKVIQSQPYGLEQKAVEAARQYKFCPALQDGQPVTQIMELRCSFSVQTIYTERPAQRPRGRRRP